MKLLFDFLPLVVFFTVGKLFNLYIGTAVLVIVCCVQLLIYRLIYKRMDKTLLITSIAVITLGALTLITQDERFIKWKPTVIYWGLALVLLASAWIGQGKTLLQRGLEKNMTLPTYLWRRLNLAWVIFFSLLGLLNLYVAYSFSSDAWLNFKLFGATLLTLTFALAQVGCLYKYFDFDKPDDPTPGNKPKNDH